MADKQHELICALKDMALTMGRTPTQDEFCMSRKGGHYQTRKFGGFSVLCQAAGLTPNIQGNSGKKIDRSIFERNIESHMEAYRGTEPLKISRDPYPSIAVISDIHWPFASEAVVNTFHEFVRLHQPEYVVLNGDAWDMYSHSKFPRSHNIFTPREEQALCVAANTEFWAKIKKNTPNAICIQMLGNHDVRPMKRIMESYPEAEDWIIEKLQSLFTFEGVRTVFDPREEVILGDIAIFHGYRTGIGAHRDFTLMSCINGHTHKGGAVFRNIRGHVLWELNSGYAGDPLAKGLTYTPQKIIDWTPGFGAVDHWGPRFIPVR